MGISSLITLTVKQKVVSEKEEVRTPINRLDRLAEFYRKDSAPSWLNARQKNTHQTAGIFYI